MHRAKIVCLLMVLLLASTAWPGQINDNLAEYMQGLADGESVSALVMFKHQADIESLNKQLKQERATLAERNRRVLEALHEAASLTQPAMASYLEELKEQGLVEDYKMLWIANILSVTATKEGIEILAERPELDVFYLNYPIELFEPVEIKDVDESLITNVEIGLERIHAPEAWALGYTGFGRVVSNIDTGVDGYHPALADRFRGDVDGDGDCDESWYDPYDTHWDFPQDSWIHGTHTMGTICGRSPAGDTIGVAIDAQWIAAAPIDRGGGIPRTVRDALLSFEWIADPDGDPNTQDNPDACGNSWGIPDGAGYPDCDETFWQVIDNCEAAGTVVIFSAGNEGYDGLRSPADRATTYYNVFSVGAVDGNNPNLPIAGFSARGPTECATGDLAIKPEVVAPGVDVRSSVPGGGYSTLSGTSMASPHITGAVAVIRQVNPDLDVDAIKEILMSTAEDLPFSNPDGEDNTFGHGIINLYEACLVAQQGYGFVEGYVYNEQEEPIAGALIQVEDSPRRTFANDEGFYHIGLPADTTYTLIASFFGYVPESAEVTVIPDDTVFQDFTLSYADYGVLNGHVTDLDSIPIEGAIVRVADTPLDSVLTDEEGYYIIDNIPGDNTYDIEATAVGYGLARATVFIPVDDTVTQDFALQEMESFEVDDAGWVGEGCWEWGEPTSGPGSAFDGNNVWATVLAGSYPNSTDDRLFTTYYTITEPTATFSFWHWYDMESGWDGGNIHVSTDGGENWELVYPESGYPQSDIIGLDGEPGFSGTSGDWQQVIVDLSAYENQTLKIKFRFGTDPSVTRAGWYIDGVVLNGGTNWGVLDPSASVEPTSFYVSLDSGDVSTFPLTVSNGGPGLLEFNAVAITDEFNQSAPPGGAPRNDYYISDNDIAKEKIGDLTYYNYIGAKTENDSPPGDGLITDFGGPDEFGYTWIDSREANGPRYAWVDITDYGVYISGLGDDTNVGPFDIGFEFPFYGNVFTTFRFCTNGYISFTSTSAEYYNQPLPYSDEPFNLVAPFWDDLDFRDAGEAYYYSSGDSLIISYINVPHYSFGSPPGPYTFQIILLANGDIIYQYQDINDPVNSNTVGIQNEDGSIATQIVYNDNYVENNLAVKIKYPLFWLTVSPQYGFLFPDESTDLDVVFDATELGTGTYTGQILLSTNDPENLTISVPCTLSVGMVGIDEDSPLTPASFSLKQNYPNPFNPVTEISFGLPTSGHTTLEVYDIMGRKVKTLVDGELPAGTHRVVWNSLNDGGKRVASGVYFYKLSHGDKVIARKMVILK